jgi:hypothetical protein
MTEQQTQNQKEKVLGKINEIKKNVETFISDVNVNELKESLNTMVKDAQKDFNKLVDKDLGNLKLKFQKEKTVLEKKAKKFFDNHKKEIKALQDKFDKLVKKNKAKAPVKSAAPTTKKQITKKVAAGLKKTTKKSAR